MLGPEHLARLLDLSRALSGAVEHGELATIAADQARVLAGASAAQITELSDEGVLSAIAESTLDAPAHRRTAPPAIQASEAAHEVVRTTAAIWIASPTEARERYPDVPLGAFSGEPETAAWAFLPLVADDQLAGVLTLAFDEVQAFDGSTRAFVTELASVCANALARGSLFTQERERANASEEARAAGEVRERRSERLVGDRTRLYERERFARARAEAETVVAVHAADDLESAQCLRAALVHSETEQDVVAALAAHGLDGFGAVRLVIARQTDDGELEITASAGVLPEVATAGTRMRSDGATAEAEVLRTGSKLWLDAPELTRRFPGMAQALRAAGAGSWLGVPLRDEGGSGVLAVAFPSERAFTPGDRERLALLAEECASVLSRRTVRDADAAARVTALAAVEEEPLVAFVAHYEEEGRDRPDALVLGVFSSEAGAREALQQLDRKRSLIVGAWITSWNVDEPHLRARVEVELME
ncbi:MAG TPA: GAF domain-containing protein [Anaeromyxobacter sp.]|nr:GAF domain-containing protein [Anaeromyxobacter sp.]